MQFITQVEVCKEMYQWVQKERIDDIKRDYAIDLVQKMPIDVLEKVFNIKEHDNNPYVIITASIIHP